MRAFPVFGGTFTLRPWPTLIAAVMLAALLGLGTWQVERLQWKRNLLTAIHERMQMQPEDVRGLAPVYMRADGLRETSTRIALGDDDYRPAAAAGLFANDKELYLTSISLKGEGGYHILTPMMLADERWILVDRGWVPYDRQSPATRRAGELDEPVTVVGYLRAPQTNWVQRHFGPANDPLHNQWYRYDLPAMAEAAGVPGFLPFVLEADAAPNPGGYPLGGQTRLTLPNNHFVYALTWFGLAWVLAVVYAVSSWRRNK
jgi:surfeit locus 1 family protein